MPGMWGGERGTRGGPNGGRRCAVAHGHAERLVNDMPTTRSATHLLSTSNDLSSACQGDGSCNAFIMADDGPHSAACPQCCTSATEESNANTLRPPAASPLTRARAGGVARAVQQRAQRGQALQVMSKRAKRSGWVGCT